MWDERRRHIDNGDRSAISPYDIEFMAMLERTLNYGHTGSSKVIPQKLMNRALLALGIIHDGFPTISDAYLSFGDLSHKRVLVHTSQWPQNSSTMRPLMCSQRSQERTYDERHYQVSATFVHLVHWVLSSSRKSAVCRFAGNPHMALFRNFAVCQFAGNPHMTLSRNFAVCRFAGILPTD